MDNHSGSSNSQAPRPGQNAGRPIRTTLVCSRRNVRAFDWGKG